jgi:hypothetical protein
MPTFAITMNGHKFRTCCADVAESHVRTPQVFGFHSTKAQKIAEEVRANFNSGEFARLLEEEAGAITSGKKTVRTNIEGLLVEISGEFVSGPFNG